MSKKDLLKPSGKMFLLGDEAIVRGALEAGVMFHSGFPGSPVAEIGDAFYYLAKKTGIYNEYSVNEKVALEAAIGASLAGIPSIVSFKHFGMNVASDSLLPAAYIEPEAPLIITVADDPNCNSSVQSEQDTRYYAKMANIPMLEPATPQEAKDFTKLAFKLSAQYRTPVIVHFTTKVAHASALVKLEKIKKQNIKADFIRDYNKYNTMPARMVEIHKELVIKMEKIRSSFERSSLNLLLNKESKSRFGIITSGIAHTYIMEALNTLNLKLPVLKLGFSHPIPKKTVGDFIKNKKQVLITEELEPIIENEVNIIAKNVNNKLIIYGKNLLPIAGEFKPEIIEIGLAKFANKKLSYNFKLHKKKQNKIKVIKRFPVMCPGCPHRASFYSVKQAVDNAIFGGDIGCYMLGFFPPYQMQDFMYDMGANISIIHGMNKVQEFFGSSNFKKKKTISFIGDGTFFHAGIPGLINAVYNKSKSLIIVMDNRITAMTGHQLNPGTGKTGMQEKATEVSIAEIAKAIGVKNVKEVDSYNIQEFTKTVKEFLGKDQLSVIIARRDCILLKWREWRKKGIKVKPFEIDNTKCKKCGACLEKLACPAISKQRGKYIIDEDLCNSCGVCLKVCPNGAISVRKD